MIPNKDIKRHKLVEPKWVSVNNTLITRITELTTYLYNNSVYGTTSSNGISDNTITISSTLSDRFITCDVVVSGSTM